MKLSECNARQKKAFVNIKHAANWIIGGLENCLYDYAETDKAYISAYNRLHDHEALVERVYSEAITSVYSDGCMRFGADAERVLKDIRFCGKDWLIARCEARVKKLGY